MYFRTNEDLGEPQVVCEAAAPSLERLATSLKWFKREVDKSYPEAKRVKNYIDLVVSDAKSLSDGLSDFMDRGCCEPELKALEAQVRALPWTFQKNRGTKNVVRVERYRDIVRAHADVITAIQKAQRTASSLSTCTP
jgi:hypothetical protein